MINASIFRGEQSSEVTERGGGALGGARNRNPVCESFSPLRVLAVCVVGIGTIGARVLGVKSLEGLALFVEYPFPHAAIACCTRCVGSYSVGFGVFLLSLALWRFYRPCDLLRVFQSR